MSFLYSNKWVINYKLNFMWIIFKLCLYVFSPSVSVSFISSISLLDLSLSISYLNLSFIMSALTINSNYSDIEKSEPKYLTVSSKTEYYLTSLSFSFSRSAINYFMNIWVRFWSLWRFLCMSTSFQIALAYTCTNFGSTHAFS